MSSPKRNRFGLLKYNDQEYLMKRKRILRLCGLICGAALTGFGILCGEPAVILQKAVKICLECIGIG